MSDVYLITGGMGCIGAWVLYHLQRQGKRAVCFDLSDDRHRLDLLLSRDEQSAITFVRGDLTDGRQVLDAFTTHGVTHVVHLAALQVPFCRANPALGAQVNVTGTVNIFEAARGAGVRQLTYASSIAVYGPPSLYGAGLLPHAATYAPQTLYGVYKVANEQTAKVYWNEYGVASVTLRPYTIYGLGRDQGLTSEPTKAMFAAARGGLSHRLWWYNAVPLCVGCGTAVYCRRRGTVSGSIGLQPGRHTRGRQRRSAGDHGRTPRCYHYLCRYDPAVSDWL